MVKHFGAISAVSLLGISLLCTGCAKWSAPTSKTFSDAANGAGMTVLPDSDIAELNEFGIDEQLYADSVDGQAIYADFENEEDARTFTEDYFTEYIEPAAEVSGFTRLNVTTADMRRSEAYNDEMYVAIYRVGDKVVLIHSQGDGIEAGKEMLASFKS